MSSAIEFTTAAAMGSLIYTAINLVKYARAQDWNAVITLVSVAIAGIAVVALGAEAEVTEKLVVMQGTDPLGTLDGASLVLLGVAYGSGWSTLTDVRKAVDNSTTAEKPKLAPKLSKSN